MAPLACVRHAIRIASHWLMVAKAEYRQSWTAVLCSSVIIAAATLLSCTTPGEQVTANLRCDHTTARTVAFPRDSALFRPGNPREVGTSAVRVYYWETVADSACGAAFAGEDSVRFDVVTDSSLPPGFSVTGHVYLKAGSGFYDFGVTLDRRAAPGGYAYVGVVDTFDMRLSEIQPVTGIVGSVEATWPVTGSASADSSILANAIRSLEVRYWYWTPRQ